MNDDEKCCTMRMKMLTMKRKRSVNLLPLLRLYDAPEMIPISIPIGSVIRFIILFVFFLRLEINRYLLLKHSVHGK
jgi:hypothetical protein